MKNIIVSFLKLVEIQTKVASVIPFAIGTAYTLYYFEDFNIENSLIFFLSMIFFDMTTTALNNYMDYKRAVQKHGYGYEEHNAITKYNLKIQSVRTIIIIMLSISLLLGIFLVNNTNFIVLFVGIICFGIGLLYSYGPIPISSTPFGEILSGLTMGFSITFLSIYIHIYNLDIINIYLKNGVLYSNFNLKILFSIFIVSVPIICGISNIMLSNNICDMKEDIINKRYTLPIYIGKKSALNIFSFIYILSYITIICGVLVKILPLISLCTILTFFKVWENIKTFESKQSKKETFVLSVKNFILVNVVYFSTIFIGIFFT